MAEEASSNQTEEAAKQQGGEPQGQHQEGTDWKAEARKWEQRAKENKAAADKLAALEKEQEEKDEAQKTELQKATEKADKAMKKLEAMEAEKKRNDMIKRIATEKEVDADLLAAMVGDTEEEIEKNAEMLKTKIGQISKYPNVNDNGGSQGGAGKLTKEEILAIKDKKKRFEAIKENADLFRK